MFWSDKEVYIIAHRQRHGRVASYLRYARQFVTNYPYSGVPADDRIAWIEVTKITATSLGRTIHHRTDVRPIGIMDGQIYARPKGQLSLWNEGHPTAVSAAETERFNALGKTSSFSNVDGRSYIVGLLGSRGTESHDLTLDGMPITIRAVHSPDHKSIVAIRPGGSSEIVLDISTEAISLGADAYQRFVSTIPSM